MGILGGHINLKLGFFAWCCAIVFFGGERPSAEAHLENGDVFSGALTRSFLRMNARAATENPTPNRAGREARPLRLGGERNSQTPPTACIKRPGIKRGPYVGNTHG